MTRATFLGLQSLAPWPNMSGHAVVTPVPVAFSKGSRFMPDYIPQSDAEFANWVANFVTYANANLAALGLVAGDMTPITTAQTTFSTTFTTHNTAVAAAASARQAKDDARMALEQALRLLVTRLQGSSAVSDAERLALGIAVKDKTPTRVGVPTSKPVLLIDTSQRLRHEVKFADEATPNSLRKPEGVSGCQIYVKIGGAPPQDPKEVVFLAIDTKSPYLTTFDGEDGGKIAHYMGRWTNTRGETGPWSETVSATITA